MHQIVMPQLARECTANQVPWDQAKGRDEGKRIRKLIKGILDNGGNAPFSAGGSHRRDNSLTSAGEGEDSPNVNQRSGSTPTTAGAGDDSPGNYYAPMSSTSPHGGHFGRRGSQQRNVTMPLSGQLHDHISENGRSTYAETMLRNVGDNYGKRHSPSPSRDQNTFNAPRHASPQHSPALQSAHPVDSANGRTFSSGHFRTGSSEASGRPRHGTEGSRPSPLDIGVHSDRDTPASAKEHKHFFPRFSRKKKEEHTEDSSTSIDSPTSPATHRTLLPFSKHNNTSQTSIGSGILASTSVAVRPVVPRDTDEPKSYAMATYDGWNYRLVDISYAESPLVIRQTVCENLGIAYSSEVTLYITTPGQADHDEPLFDDLLVHARRTMADKDGTLRIWVNFPGSVPSAGLGLGLSTGMQPNHKRSQATDQSRGRGNSNISVESPSVRSDGESTLVPGQGDALRNLLNKNHSPVETVRQPAGIRTWNDGQVSDAERAMSLSHAAEMYRQQTEQKREAYLEGRRRQLSKGSPTDAPSGPGIRGRAVDFDDKDKKRKTPYDQKDYKPMRDPPPVPPDTNTLIKANSLTKKGGQRLRNSWGDDDESIGKRRSHESDRPKSSGSVRMQGSPLRREESNGQRSMASALGAANRLNGSPGGSPRSPALTRSPGNVDFRVPDFYGEEPTDFELNGSESQESTLTQTTANAVKAASINRTGSGNKPELKLQTKMTHPGIARAKSSEYGRRGSPEVSPSTEQPLNRMISKRGPTHDFQEANISFTDRGSAGAEASDSDSDDGLFAMRIRKTDQTSSTATPTPGPSKPTQQDDGEERRPSLSLDTNSNNVRFESPVRSAVPQSASTDSPADDMKRFESGLERDGVRIPQSAASTTWSPEEPISFNRRESFASDVWANRPPAEALVEHLDEFFPNVNLDQPVMEEELGGTPTSPGGTQGPSATFNLGRSGTPMSSLSENEEYEDGIGSLNRGGFTSIAQRNMRKSGGLGRTKSIRDVVKDAYTPGSRNSFVGAPAPARVNTLKQAAEGAIMRRKSTKMFGAKIEQVKPQRQSRLIQLETIPQDTLPVPNRQPTFKWMKGQLIGKGTFGRVYLGMNMTTGELIAVKQVEVNPKAHGQDKEKMTEMVKSLDVEIDTMKDLDHPNIVSYLGSEKKDYSISIFLEYIPGGSVGSCLRKHGKFEESIVSSLTRQTLSALAYLHREGVLHRDLKSDNILLDLDGTCKISDFGISKKTDDIYGNDVTNSMQGSVFWMAPEVIRSQGQGYSAKVDVWSLGCVVLEMFAGRRPWSKEEAIGAIYKLGSLNEAPPIPDDVSSDISPQAISFMYDCFTMSVYTHNLNFGRSIC